MPEDRPIFREEHLSSRTIISFAKACALACLRPHSVSHTNKLVGGKYNKTAAKTKE